MLTSMPLATTLTKTTPPEIPSNELVSDSPTGHYARDVISRTFTDVKELIRQLTLDNRKRKSVLKAFKVTGPQDTKIGTKLKLAPMKMT